MNVNKVIGKYWRLWNILFLMKNKYLFFGVVFIGLLNASCLKLFVPTTVVFKDGRQVNGISREFVNYSWIKFKNNDGGRIYKMHLRNIDTITKTLTNNKIEFYTRIPYLKREILTQELIKDYMSLYKYTNFVPFNRDVRNNYTSMSSEKYEYYTIKQKEPTVLFPTFNSNIFVNDELKFKKYAEEQFFDEPSLLAKIGSAGYKHKDFIKVIEEYNKIKKVNK
jgi:hypothetical protein